MVGELTLGYLSTIRRGVCSYGTTLVVEQVVLPVATLLAERMHTRRKAHSSRSASFGAVKDILVVDLCVRETQ